MAPDSKLKWNFRPDTVPELSKETFDAIMARWPMLSAFGLVPSEGNAPFTYAEVTTAASRQEYEAAYEVIGQFCTRLTRRGQRAGSRGSYGFKHDVEQSTGRYVSNGMVILAAVASGYEIVPDDCRVKQHTRVEMPLTRALNPNCSFRWCVAEAQLEHTFL